MKKTLLVLVSITAIFGASCVQEGANVATTTNKPANATNMSNGNSSASAASAESEIRKLMDTAATALAKNDADAMDKIYGENYMLVNIDGSVQTRAERLNALRTGGVKYTSFNYEDANIRVNPEGTGAVVIGRLSMKGTSNGKPIDGSYRVTQVYSKTKDGWKQVTAQATLITAPTAASPASGLPTPTDPTAGLPTPEPKGSAPANKK